MVAGFIKSVAHYISLVKFQHTVFALPFALVGYFLAISQPGYDFSFLLLVQVVACMVFARNAAMGFNRYIDRKIDGANPRTAAREVPSGIVSPSSVLIFVVVNCILFIGVAFTINLLCFYLSFPAIFVLIGYSYTKRFTSLCHLILGLALAIAPSAAYISVTSHLSLSVVILSLLVLFWVSGFDILYSVSDEEFDRENKLHSIPQLFGKSGAFHISLYLHLFVIPLLILLYFSADMGWLYIIGASLFVILLIYQHCIVSPTKLSRLNAAFFTSNGVASLVFAIFTISDLYIKIMP